MEDMQTEQLMDAESGSTEAVAAPSTPETGALDTSSQTPDSDPKGIAFGKALTAEREKIRKEMESEYSEKYKGHEDFKYLADYLQEANGLDVMTLKEKIELERLQDRAERENVSPETLKRIDQLEAKAAKGDELEKKLHEDQRVQSYFGTLNEFVKDKGIEAEKLNQFMIENGLQYDPNNMEKSFTIAYKAMRSDELEAKLQTAEKDAVKNYLDSKKGPRVEGSTGTVGVQSVDTSKMSWKELDRHAQSRLDAAKTPQ